MKLPIWIEDTNARIAFGFLTILVIVLGWAVITQKPGPVIQPTAVIVQKAALEKSKPDTIRTFVQKLVYVKSTPIVKEVTPHEEERNVNLFCSAAGYSLPGQPTRPLSDTISGIAHPDSVRQLPIHVLALANAGRINGSRFDVWTTRTDGAEGRLAYKIHGNFAWRMVGDSILVTYPRLWWLRPVLRDAAMLGIGAGIGHIIR